MKNLVNNLQEKGSSIIEFTLLLPLLWILVASSCELYKALQVHQVLSVISREIGNATVRNCNTFDPNVSLLSASDISDAQKCVQDSVSNIISSATSVGSPVRQAKIVTRLFRASGVGVSPVPVIEVIFDPSKYDDFVSKYSPDVVQQLNSYKNGKKDLIVTTEVFLKLPSMAPCFNGQYYETTIF